MAVLVQLGPWVARAVAMLGLLNHRFEVPLTRMAIAGYAETNETEEGRARNRRVDLVILNRIGMEMEPPATAAPAKSAH